jgi:hypothetical protein
MNEFSSRFHPPIPIRDQKIVILEGPDGCGKTNVAQGLSLDLKVPYYKMRHEHGAWQAGTFKEELQFGEPRQVELLRQLSADVVIDRGHPSEWVYSLAFNRETDLALLRKVDDEYARMGAYIVILLRHDYSKSRPDELVELESLPILHEHYLSFAQWTKCDCVVLYVDAFGNDLKRELDVLRPELRWGDQMIGLTKTITLDRNVIEKQSVLCESKTISISRDFDLTKGQEKR